MSHGKVDTKLKAKKPLPYANIAYMDVRDDVCLNLSLEASSVQGFNFNMYSITNINTHALV